MAKDKEISLVWRVHTRLLFEEIVSNNEMQCVRQPLRIMNGILQQVALRASEINDDKLNALMCRLTLYTISDPHSPDYDSKKCNDIIKKGT